MCAHESEGLARVPDYAELDRFGEAVALVDEAGTRTTFSELASLADRFAAKLGDERRLVAIAIANEVEPIAAYLGAMRAGHPVLLLSSAAEAARSRILDTYVPDVVFAKDGDSWALEMRPPRGGLHPDLALLLSTSGTTGTVKLVRLSHQAISANAAAIAGYLDIKPTDRAVTSLPLYYSYGLSVLNSHFQAGASLLLTERSVIESEFWELCGREHATAFAGVPHMYELLDRSGFRDKMPGSVHTLTQAGGRLPPDRAMSLARWAEDTGRKFFVMYGQTEASPRMAYLPPQMATEHADCIGVPIPGGSFALRDADGETIDSCGVTGELVYSGENVMMGYALSRDDLALGRTIDCLRTGDLAQQTDDGLYKIVGRKSRFVKPFGLRVSLDEIEAALSREDVDAIAAGDDELIAIAIRGEAESAGVIAWLSSRYELPESLFDVVQVREFPTLGSGKIDYAALLRSARERRRVTNDVRSDRGFTRIFAEHLNRSEVSATDSFVSLDGDSLSYISVVTEIDRKLGHVPDGWESLTISELDRLADRPHHSEHRWLRPISSGIAVRAVAITGVVLNHARFHSAVGGSDALLMLAGYNLARFKSRPLSDGRAWTVLWSFVKRIVVPYYFILLAYAALDKRPHLSSFLLVDNFATFPHKFQRFLTPYWFIEALLHIMVLMTLVFSIGPVRRFAARRPLAFGATLLLTAIFIRLVAFQAFDHRGLRNFSTDAVLPIFALGWVMYFARSITSKVACVTLAVLLALANASVLHSELLFGGWSRDVGLTRMAWIVASAGIVLLVPRLWLPKGLGLLLTAIAGLSFTIYLTHMIPVQLFRWIAHAPPIVTTVATILFAFLVHAGIAWVVRSAVIKDLKARVESARNILMGGMRGSRPASRSDDVLAG